MIKAGERLIDQITSVKGLWLASFLLLLGASPIHEKTSDTVKALPSEKIMVDKLSGFWLGQSIANWTGLITEMDRNEAPFYTDEDWGKVDSPSKWGQFVRHSSVIDFYIVSPDKVWGSDDDTDIEYMYLHLLDGHKTGLLSGEEIRDGWLKHIYSNDDAPIEKHEFQRENYLWVSNERARELMAGQKMVPPQTSDPKNNKHYNMIDAQLTTEMFGLLAPNDPEFAEKLATLPIRTTARGNAELIAHFYVHMHAMAVTVDPDKMMGPQIVSLAERARSEMPDASLPAKMYDFIKADYLSNPDKSNWERTRNNLYKEYQLGGKEGYQYQWPFDSEINYAASLISLFYGQGDFKRTIQIGSLVGWDSDNPTATWGGLLGYIYGSEKVLSFFAGKPMSQKYWIHRTRRNFPDHTPNEIGEDRFDLMAKRMLKIIKRINN